ncbi:MAG: AraC family ligand binding domain-containing protein, partial [Clostridia bacterium]|nr:AraC family ligand binding domain-containing protein [Clostridia bacterium]
MSNLYPDLYNIPFIGIIKESLPFGITCEYNDLEDKYLQEKTAGRHYHPYYELTLICSGSVLFDVNNNISRHTVGMIHLVRPQDHHSMILTGPLQYICLKFYMDIMASEIIDLVDDTDVPLIIQTEEQTENYIVEAKHLCTLYQEIKSSPSRSELLQLELRLKAQLFLLRFVNVWQKTHYIPKQHERKISCIHKALAYIHYHFTENITLAQAAKAAEISPNYLSSVF